MSRPPGKALVDTSSELERQPQAFYEQIESQKHNRRSGYVPQTRLDVNGYGTVSLVQLSLQSHDDDKSRVHQRSTSDHSYASRLRQSFPSEHGNLDSGIAEQLREYYGLSPSTYVDQRHEYMHRPVGPGLQSPTSAQAPHTILQDQRAIASSPFFQRAPPAFRPDATQRPPTRMNQAKMMAYDLGRGISIANTATPQNFIESRGLTQSPVIDPSHRPGDHQALYDRPQYHAGVPTHGQYTTKMPQTPRNSQGLLRRPDRPPSVVHRSPVKSESRKYNGRITLPPLIGPSLPMAATQDEALSQIRGVRGVSSHRHIPGYQPAASNYNVARTLFPAGPRQSVRR